ncbi:MAG: DUF3298 domain-containing protein [Clostridia bacterium]
MPFQLPAGIETKTIASHGTSIVYPQVVGLPDRQVEDQINQQIAGAVKALIRGQAQYQTSTRMEMVGHYEIKTNERGILSLTLTNYAYSYPMAHGVTLMKSLSFNVNTAQQYQLSDLFKKESNYVEIISKNVAAQIKQRDLPLIAPFTSISPNQDYYLADKALVVYFPPYEITPGYVGFPMFPISVYEVNSLAPEDSPITILSADIA